MAKKCEKCEYLNEDDAKFCVKCGEGINVRDRTLDSVEGKQSVDDSQVVEIEKILDNTETEKKKKSKLNFLKNKKVIVSISSVIILLLVLGGLFIFISKANSNSIQGTWKSTQNEKNTFTIEKNDFVFTNYFEDSYFGKVDEKSKKLVYPDEKMNYKIIDGKLVVYDTKESDGSAVVYVKKK